MGIWEAQVQGRWGGRGAPEPLVSETEVLHVGVCLFSLLQSLRIGLKVFLIPLYQVGYAPGVTVAKRRETGTRVRGHSGRRKHPGFVRGTQALHPHPLREIPERKGTAKTSATGSTSLGLGIPVH